MKKLFMFLCLIADVNLHASIQLNQYDLLIDQIDKSIDQKRGQFFDVDILNKALVYAIEHGKFNFVLKLLDSKSAKNIKNPQMGYALAVLLEKNLIDEEGVLRLLRFDELHEINSVYLYHILLKSFDYKYNRLLNNLLFYRSFPFQKVLHEAIKYQKTDLVLVMIRYSSFYVFNDRELSETLEEVAKIGNEEIMELFLAHDKVKKIDPMYKGSITKINKLLQKIKNSKRKIEPVRLTEQLEDPEDQLTGQLEYSKELLKEKIAKFHKSVMSDKEDSVWQVLKKYNEKIGEIRSKMKNSKSEHKNYYQTKLKELQELEIDLGKKVMEIDEELKTVALRPQGISLAEGSLKIQQLKDRFRALVQKHSEAYEKIKTL